VLIRTIAAALRQWRRGAHDPAAGLGDLEAALTGEGCPVCARTGDADERWLDHFLYEGYLERAAMQQVARGGGLCAYHTGRIETLGTSAAVALIYHRLIEDCLPRLASAREARRSSLPLIAAPGFCEACAQAGEVERRECYFLAQITASRPPDRYGNPALVCMPHLRRLAPYVDDNRLGGILALHRRSVAALAIPLAAAPVCAGGRHIAEADRAIRLILGARPDHRGAPPAGTAPESEGAAFAADPDPARRLRRRLRHLASCAICAEIADSVAQSLSWLAQAAEGDGDLSDVLPLCRAHVGQARAFCGPALAPALAAVVVREAEERLVYAGRAGEPAGGRAAAFVAHALRHAGAGAARRRAVLEALRRGRECPLCRQMREAGERAIQLLAVLLEIPDTRRAFENGHGLCVRHAAQTLAMPVPPAIATIVAATTHARLALLRWELEEQLRRGAWQARPQRRGAESAAWLNAGARFAGTVGRADLGG
jgi:hypothetical protein